jgi:hypothetical protein
VKGGSRTEEGRKRKKEGERGNRKGARREGKEKIKGKINPVLFVE